MQEVGIRALTLRGLGRLNPTRSGGNPKLAPPIHVEEINDIIPTLGSEMKFWKKEVFVLCTRWGLLQGNESLLVEFLVWLRGGWAQRWRGKPRGRLGKEEREKMRENEKERKNEERK